MNYTTSSIDTLYGSYREQMQKIADIKYAAAVLQWDQETYLPTKGANARARQLATLSELAHNASVAESIGDILQELAGRKLDFVQQKNVELSLEEFNKQKKYTSAFVRTMSEAISKAFYSWIEARKTNNFNSYIPELSFLVDLKIKETEILGYEKHPYDSLLHEFEKSASVTMLDKVFMELEAPLKQLIEKGKIATATDDSFLQQQFSKDEQWSWGLFLLKELHFDFEAGRQDISEHPFTTNFSAEDVRVTTRIDEHDFKNMTWSCIHELGHALYEQGLPVAEYGLPSGEYASLSIHESQSRLWENCVGRSIDFWSHYFPILQSKFPAQLQHISLSQFVKAINQVKPSLIRTEADELTYHFHVGIRYEIEKQIISKQLPVKDIRDRWNELYKNYLAVDVPDDKQGCLQDVHWSHGSFGYFPTYSLGSFYAAQFFTKAQQEINELENNIQNGDTSSLLNWLRTNIHAHGKLYNSEELCRKITGEALNIDYFINYTKRKYQLLNDLQ
jgi:carboxypeptidase Taq